MSAKPSRRDLEGVAKALRASRGSRLLPAGWEQFELAVATILAAIEHGDVAVIKEQRKVIEHLDLRQQHVAGPGRDVPVEQPERVRAAADNLTRRIEKVRADEDREKR
ncbi:MAG: hypothetical protein ABW000_13100 [Actinoplanes sp.]